MLHVTEDNKNGGPKLVMLHGIGGTHRYWNTGIEVLAKRFHVIRLDLFGFGDSPQPWQNYTQEKHLQAIEFSLKKYPSFSKVGHSLGAALALRYAEKYPHKVCSLILISLPLFQDQTRAYQWMRRTPSGWFMTNMVIAALTCLTTRYLAKRILPIFLKEFPTEIIHDLVKHNVMSSITTLWNVLYNQSFIKDLDRLNSRLLVYCIHAKNDITAPYLNVDKLIRTLPQWQLITLSQSGHHPWLWNNKACLDILNQSTKSAID